MKIGKHRYYRPIGSLGLGESAYVSHEAIKISLSGEIYVDTMALIYPIQTEFHIRVMEDGELEVIDHSQHVWAVTAISDIDFPRHLTVANYMEAHSAT